MTIQSQTTRVDYTGNGATINFPVPFYWLQDTDLLVIRTDSAYTPPTVATLALGTDYAVVGSGNQSGGSITTTVAPTATQKLSILRNVPFTQLTHYVPNDPFPAASHEQALDKLTMETQQLNEGLSRSITLPPNATGLSTNLPLPAANNLIGWNPTANALQNVDPTTIATSVTYGNAVADKFSGDGSTVNFNLSANPGGVNNLDVSIGGVTQRPGIDYTWTSGTTLAFTVAPPAGTNNVLARYAQALPIGSLGVGQVTGANLAAGAVTDAAVSVSAAIQSTKLSFTQTGTGAVARTIQSKLSEAVFSLTDFGADGTGVADSTAAIQLAVNACPTGAWLDGGGLTYRVNGAVTANGATFYLRNAKFVTTTNYSSQGQININSNTVSLVDIVFDGGRGTYKTGSETWATFGSFNGYNSIQPSLNPFFNITAYNAAAVVCLQRLTFLNVFAVAAINVGTYGTVQISNHVYRNCANCTFTVYHSPDNGTTVAGRTEVNNVYAENIGLLPTTFLINGVSTNFSTTTGLPQGSFNYLVSFGDFAINNAWVWNYGATAVTFDRNTNVEASNIYVLCTASNALSNNPSGAIWLEAAQKANLTNITINIQSRDSRDYAQDSCAMQLFVLENQQLNLSNIKLLGNKSSAVSNRAIRGSLFSSSAGNHIHISNLYVDGLYVANAMNFALSTNSLIRSRIRISQAYVDSGNVNIEQPNVLEITNMQTSGDVTVVNSGNTGITGTVAIVSLRSSNINNFTCAPTVAGTFACNDNETISGQISAVCTGSASVSNNKVIAGSVTLSSGSATAGTFQICNNGNILGITTVTFAKSAIVCGNTTARRIELKDVQTLTVTGNTAKTDQPESILWVNPITGSNVLSGTICGNTVLIKTGTSSAGYVTFSGGVASVTDVNNTKATVAWS